MGEYFLNWARSEFLSGIINFGSEVRWSHLSNMFRIIVGTISTVYGINVTCYDIMRYKNESQRKLSIVQFQCCGIVRKNYLSLEYKDQLK